VGKVLAVLIALVAAAVAFTWWRSPEVPAVPLAQPPAGAGPGAPPASAGSTGGGAVAPARPLSPRAPAASRPGPGGPLALAINSEADLLAAMRELGIEDLDERMTRWAVSRGYPEFDQAGNYLLDQPYQQYDEQTLRGLAEADDMWAQQLLAQEIAADRPAEALEWYGRAAANGSVYAMQEMARLYHRMSGQLRDLSAQDDAQSLTQEFALRDASSPDVSAYAWLAAAEAAGWDPTRAASLIPLLGRKLSPEQVTEACALAQSLRVQLDADRSGRGLQPFDRTPPPIVYSGEELGAATQCNSASPSAFDLSGCREADVQTGGTSTRVWVCASRG
jgi:hypothetical protein